MKTLKHIITHPVTISLIGLLVLSLLVWFGGPHIKFGATNTAPLGKSEVRLLVITLIVVLWGLNNLRIQITSQKNNKKFIEDIRDSEEPAQDLAASQASEEIYQMNERFAQALSTLQKLKVSGRGRKKAIYELPWYIIVGPPGSGKTTALVNSGLDFPLADQFGKGAVQGVGGTRNCDWWFTNEAVLIDTAGRYTTQDSHRVVDSSAWEGFLNLLKRHRRRRPINGAIVAISLHDLLTQTEEERLQQARTIRLRLDELMEKLEIRFPVYVLFTKSDMVSGFTEFFEDLGREERDQVWGVTLPDAPKATQVADFDLVNTELSALANRLYDRVIWRLHQERDARRSGAIQGFPQQMENVNVLVERFIRETFAQNRFHLQPYLRGVYFSSGTQDGTSVDRLMTAVSANFGFSQGESYLPSPHGKSFFIAQLFRNVIFPESEIVGSNARYENFIRWSQRAAYASLAIITILVFLGWSGSLTRNKLQISEIAKQVQLFKEEEARIPSWNNDVRQVLPALNALAHASKVYENDKHPWLSGIGLYDGRVASDAAAAYGAKLSTLLLPKLLDSLETSLRSVDGGGDLYNTFRVYMMFQKVEHMDQQLVGQWFDAHWTSQFRGDGTRRMELQQHLDALLATDIAPQELNQNVVASARAALMRVPVSQRVYSRLKGMPEYQRSVNLLNHYGESIKSTFRLDERTLASLSVPALFTLDAYKNIDFTPSSTFVADVVNERWILADEDGARVDFIDRDLDDISAQVKEHYLAEYSKVWLDVYRTLEIASYNDLRQLNDVLRTFVDPVYSPLLSILQVGKVNTELTPGLGQMAEKLEELGGEAGQVGGQAGYMGGRASNLAAGAGRFFAESNDGTVVDQRFREVNILLQGSSRSPAPIESTMRRIEELQQFVEDITLAPDPARKSFEVAKARYQSGASNPITSLRNHARSAPEPVRRWLISLADESWKVVLLSAHQHVNMEWQAQVYRPYQQALAGRYPLHRSSRDELAMADFISFFKPQGTLHQFFGEYLEPFVETRGRWSNRTVDNYSMGFSAGALSQLQRSAEIRNIYFRENRDHPSISLELRPYNMAKNEARFMLDMGADQRLSYSHGPKFWRTVKWSGGGETQRIRLVFEDLNKVTSDRVYSGPWAWFRMLDEADIKPANESNIYWITFRPDLSASVNRDVVLEGKASSVHNPFKNDLLSQFRCPESI